MRFTKIIDSKRNMKLALATVVILALLATVTLVYSWTKKSELQPESKNDRSNSDVGDNKEITNKIKRSLDDEAVYGPSGLESDVDDTRDADVHDRRELLGEAESEVDCLDGYPCREKRSVTNNDIPKITLPNTKNDENAKRDTSDDAKDESAEASSETNDENDDDKEEEYDGYEYEGDEPIKITKRSYMTEFDLKDLDKFENGEYPDIDDDEDFAEKYKREANGDDDQDEGIHDTDDKEIDEDVESIEGNGADDEENEGDNDGKHRRHAESSFHHIDEKLHKNAQDDDSIVSDQLEEEMYNPPYNLVSSESRRRKRSLPQYDDDNEESQNEDFNNDDDNEGESDDEDDDSMTKRELDEIDNDSNDEDDDEESDVDDDVETEYNEQRYKRDGEEDDNDEIEEDDEGDDDYANNNEGSDDDTDDENKGDDDSGQQKRTTEDKKTDSGGGDFKPISSVRKTRGFEYPDEPEASDNVAYDEVDKDPNSGYTQWEYWGPCSVTCGVGRSVRRRTCNDKRYCLSGDYEERVCFPEACETDDNKK